MILNLSKYSRLLFYYQVKSNCYLIGGTIDIVAFVLQRILEQRTDIYPVEAGLFILNRKAVV